MKVCIPVTSADGLSASLEPNFVAAQHLLIMNMGTGEQRTFSQNADQETDAPEEPIAVDVVICADMHPQILQAFSAQGIKVFATAAQTVAMALDAFKAGELEELVADMEMGGCCGGGGCGGAGHDHDHGDDHECCGGANHADDHECCGGHGHGEGKGGCGCHG